jgi:hypothetical protein
LCSIFEWLGSRGDAGFSSLAFRLALARFHSGKYVQELHGLTPGASKAQRSEAARKLHSELSQKFGREGLWSVENIESEVFLDPRNLGFIALYITGDLPNDYVGAKKNFRAVGAQEYLSLAGGELVSMIWVILNQNEPLNSATYEIDHVTTNLQHDLNLAEMTIEARIISEMRSQLARRMGDVEKPFEEIRKLFNEHYIEAFSQGAVAVLDEHGRALNITPRSPHARAEIEKFLASVETLLNSGITREKVVDLLIRVDTFSKFYLEFSELT